MMAEELRNRQQEYLSRLTRFEMSASSNCKSTTGFVSLELRGEVEKGDISIGSISIKVAFKYMKLE